METWQHRALEAHKQGEYGTSAKLFGRAIESCSETRVVELMTLLDQRASCLEKINLDDALKDAKRMVRTDKTSPLGYLRLGKVMDLMGHAKGAAKIYQQGVVRCDKKHKRFNALQKLAKDATPYNKQGRDPLISMPYEILHMILRQLTFKMLVKCLMVSKSWNEFIRKDARLWSNLVDFTSSKQVSYSTVKRYVQYAMPVGLQSIGFANIKRADEVRCLEVLRLARRIDELDMYISRESLVKFGLRKLNVRVLRVVTDLRPWAIIDALRIPGIEELYWVYTGNSANFNEVRREDKGLKVDSTVKSLGIKGALEEFILADVLAHCPKLESLELHQCMKYDRADNMLRDFLKGRKMRKFKFIMNYFCGMPRVLPTGMKEFGITCSSIADDTTELLAENGTDLSEVIALDLTLLRLVDDQNPLKFLTFLRACRLTNVRRATLNYCTVVLDYDKLAELWPDLEELSLYGSSLMFDDDAIKLIAFKNLKILNLGHTMVTDRSVRKIIEGLPKLRHLNVSNCTLMVETFNWLNKKVHLFNEESLLGPVQNQTLKKMKAYDKLLAGGLTTDL